MLNNYKLLTILFLLILTLLACSKKSNGLSDSSEDVLPEDFDYLGYWSNNQDVQDECGKLDSICIKDHWINIGESRGLSYTISDIISSSSSKNTKSSSSITSSSSMTLIELSSSSIDPIESSSSSSIDPIESSSSSYVSSSSSVIILTTEDPTFSVTAGAYTSVQSVALETTTLGAAIHYTIDGSTPTISNDLYTTPITINSTQTIKAIAVKAGWNNSNIVSAEYIVDITSGTFMDSRDSKVYKWTKISSRIWMAENINYNASGSLCNDCDTYGRLYTWATAMSGEASSKAVPSGVHGVCPDGWHIPSESEMGSLKFYGADKLKSTTGWTYNSGTNQYGFSALPAGNYNTVDRKYNGVGADTYWWTATEEYSSELDAESLYLGTILTKSSANKALFAFSIRCLKNEPW